MTQEQKTEAVIKAPLPDVPVAMRSMRRGEIIIAHARDLSRTLDAVLNMCQNAEGADAQDLADSILDLVEADQENKVSREEFEATATPEELDAWREFRAAFKCGPICQPAWIETPYLVEADQ